MNKIGQDKKEYNMIRIDRLETGAYPHTHSRLPTPADLAPDALLLASRDT